MTEKLPEEHTVPKKKKKGPRTRAERLEYAAGLKRGTCIELFRPVTQCTPADLGFADVDIPVNPAEINSMQVGELCEKLNIEVSDLMFKLVNHTEGMRDLADVRQVMVEGDIINGVIPARCMPMVQRVPTQTYKFKTN